MVIYIPTIYPLFAYHCWILDFTAFCFLTFFHTVCSTVPTLSTVGRTTPLICISPYLHYTAHIAATPFCTPQTPAHTPPQPPYRTATPAPPYHTCTTAYFCTHTTPVHAPFPAAFPPFSFRYTLFRLPGSVLALHTCTAMTLHWIRSCKRRFTSTPFPACGTTRRLLHLHSLYARPHRSATPMIRRATTCVLPFSFWFVGIYTTRRHVFVRSPTCFPLPTYLPFSPLRAAFGLDLACWRTVKPATALLPWTVPTLLGWPLSATCGNNTFTVTVVLFIHLHVSSAHSPEPPITSLSSADRNSAALNVLSTRYHRSRSLRSVVFICRFISAASAPATAPTAARRGYRNHIYRHHHFHRLPPVYLLPLFGFLRYGLFPSFLVRSIRYVLPPLPRISVHPIFAFYLHHHLLCGSCGRYVPIVPTTPTVHAFTSLFLFSILPRA